MHVQAYILVHIYICNVVVQHTQLSLQISATSTSNICNTQAALLFLLLLWLLLTLAGWLYDWRALDFFVLAWAFLTLVGSRFFCFFTRFAAWLHGVCTTALQTRGSRKFSLFAAAFRCWHPDIRTSTHTSTYIGSHMHTCVGVKLLATPCARKDLC